MSTNISRRHFLAASAATGLALSASASQENQAGNQKLIVGVIGTGGRGTRPGDGLPAAARRRGRLCLRRRPGPGGAGGGGGAEDRRPRAARRQRFSPHPRRQRSATSSWSPPAITGTPRPPSWPAPPASTSMSRSRAATIRARASCWSQAARKHNKHVQMGNQRRSWPKIIEAIDQVRKGSIGRAYFAESWYQANRGTHRPRQAGRRPPRARLRSLARARHRAGRSTPITCTTTGTGSGTGATASWATTAST